MRVVRGVVLALLLVSLGGVVAGCDTLENFQFWDTKKKLPGDRKPVFPEGVPGVTQGIPPDLVKGYQEPQQPGVDPAAAAAAQISAEETPKERKAEQKPKPKPRKVAAPRPAPQPQAAQQQQQQPQPQQQAPWPGSQPQAQQQQGSWPTAR